MFKTHKRHILPLPCIKAGGKDIYLSFVLLNKENCGSRQAGRQAGLQECVLGYG